MKMYRLYAADGRTDLGEFLECDIRAAVEKIAGGRPWGWRAEFLELHAICDYKTIAIAIEI